MPLERIGLCNPSHETMVHMCCAYGGYHSLINYVNCRSDTFFIGSTEKLLIKASNKAWSVFAEAYRAEAQGFMVYHHATHFLHSLSGDSTLRTQLNPKALSSFLSPFVTSQTVLQLKVILTFSATFSKMLSYQ